MSRRAAALPPGIAGQLLARAVRLALDGDATMLRELLRRTLPPRDAAVRLRLPPLDKPSDAVAASSALVAAAASGKLAPAEAAALGALVDGFLRAVGIADIERRIAALEQRAATEHTP
jgi:hypothetical protein